MATKRKVRKNRRIKFSEKNYVEKNFMRGKKAVIPVKLSRVEDLYMKNDYKQNIIAKDITEYIDIIAYMIPINTNIELEIHCPEIDEETQETIKKNIKNNYAMDIDDDEYDISRANKKSVILAIVGVLLLIINFLTYKYVGSIISDLITVIWWVAIWDMVEIQIFDNGDKKWDRLNNQQLYDCTFSFIFDIDENGKIINNEEETQK